VTKKVLREAHVYGSVLSGFAKIAQMLVIQRAVVGVKRARQSIPLSSLTRCVKSSWYTICALRSAGPVDCALGRKRFAIRQRAWAIYFGMTKELLYRTIRSATSL
jgi:hypothetical protein